ncbi:MAG: prephenate dehydrogenase [Paludibacteraceae bacterium]|nr:prephenate dehydrogenase [Paludibacteraceae bacterium]MBN2787966.1 prephenate dehydrogenase [Paludibacteraceae bacterium]
MKVIILGGGKMGSFFRDTMALNHDVLLLPSNPKKLESLPNVYDEILEFEPELLINCSTLKFTVEVFERVIPYLPKTCILSDIASVKTELPAYYKSVGMRYVSTHPMFGPTFANLNDLSSHNAIIITESDEEGKDFFRQYYASLKLNIFEYSFLEHDETIAYSLSIPFASTLVFASVMKKQEAPGTTFRKHMEIAKGLLSEDDYLLSEILFNPFTSQQVTKIREQLAELLVIIESKDSVKMEAFLKMVRKNIE